MNLDVKYFNMVFIKVLGCIVFVMFDVVWLCYVWFFDYEIELGFVMKCEVMMCELVMDVNLYDYVVGIVIVNDYLVCDI